MSWRLLRISDLTNDPDYLTSQTFPDPDPATDPNRSVGYQSGFDGNSVVKVADVRAILVLYDVAGSRVAPGTGTFSATVLELMRGAGSSPLPITDTGVVHSTQACEESFALTLPGPGEYIVRLHTFATLPGGATEGRLFVKEV